LNGLDQAFDASKLYSKQSCTITKNIIPIIRKAMNPSLQASSEEVEKIVKQLHKSRREIWLKKSNGNIMEFNKRHHVAARREQVIYFIYY
jgi:hypothetical protein